MMNITYEYMKCVTKPIERRDFISREIANMTIFVFVFVVVIVIVIILACTQHTHNNNTWYKRQTTLMSSPRSKSIKLQYTHGGHILGMCACSCEYVCNIIRNRNIYANGELYILKSIIICFSRSGNGHKHTLIYILVRIGLTIYRFFFVI